MASKTELKIVDDIKSILLIKIDSLDEVNVNYSELIINGLGKYSYQYVYNVFKKVTGISISKFITNAKIEKVKQLLIEEMSLSDIVYKVGYCSLAHLSKSFKDATGMSPLKWKKKIPEPQPITRDIKCLTIVSNKMHEHSLIEIMTKYVEFCRTINLDPTNPVYAEYFLTDKMKF